MQKCAPKRRHTSWNAFPSYNEHITIMFPSKIAGRMYVYFRCSFLWMQKSFFCITTQMTVLCLRISWVQNNVISRSSSAVPTFTRIKKPHSNVVQMNIYYSIRPKLCDDYRRCCCNWMDAFRYWLWTSNWRTLRIRWTAPARAMLLLCASTHFYAFSQAPWWSASRIFPSPRNEMTTTYFAYSLSAMQFQIRFFIVCTKGILDISSISTQSAFVRSKPRELKHKNKFAVFEIRNMAKSPPHVKGMGEPHAHEHPHMIWVLGHFWNLFVKRIWNLTTMILMLRYIIGLDICKRNTIKVYVRYYTSLETEMNNFP